MLFAVSVTEMSLNSHEFEWRPRHMSLLLVLLREGPCRLGLVGFSMTVGTELLLVIETCRGCSVLLDVYVGLVGWALEVGGNCSGGSTIGDLDRRRELSDRERLRDRPRRTRAAMAPKNDSSVGDAGDCAALENVDVGENASEDGDMAPND